LEDQRKVNWTALGTLAAVAAAIFAYKTYQDNKAQENAKLVVPPQPQRTADDVVPAAEHLPCGPNLPTPISFRNDGRQEALLKQVILSNGKWVPTPRRPNIIGAGKTVQVYFEPRHYVKELKEFILVLKAPAPIPGGGQWTTLNVALIYPEAVGKTFVGKVTIVFDGLEQMHFTDVQLDALARIPE